MTDIYEHNSENPKMIKQYPDLKNDYLALCEYAFYEPALKNLSYDSLILTREKSKDRIDDGIDKIRVKLKKNDEFGIILNNYSKILEVLKDKEEEMSKPNFWDDKEKADETLKSISASGAAAYSRGRFQRGISKTRQ